MNKLTDTDKLTRVVERAVRGGWNKYCKWKIALDPHRRLCVFITESKSSFHHNGLSLPELISDSGFMKAVYGDRDVCATEGGTKECCFKNNINDESPHPCQHCKRNMTLADYHAHEALTLLRHGGNPIQYLYDRLPKEGE